jgi:Tol biopolymer transport system component
VDSNGNNLSFLASRGGYDGTFPILDIYDFHGGSSEVPKWGPEDKFIYYTRKINDKIEIMKASINDKKLYRITNSKPGVINYNPILSPNGKWILFGSKMGKKRFLKIIHHDGQGQKILLEFPEGYGGYWPFWRSR